MSGLLDGVTVLDLAGVGPAVRASGWLADYGADVIKVGPLPRDAGTALTPKPHFYSGGRGTRRVQIDLKAPAGRDAFLKLTEHADVVIESFRPGVVDRLGIGYDAVKSANPRIVYCSTSGYGQTGERSQWAGHDLNYLAVAGFLAGTEPTADGKPTIPGSTVADSAGGGMQAVIAILAALVSRAATGEGGYLDVAVADGVLALMALQIDDVLATGAEQAPGAAPLSGRYACYDIYRAADDRWLAVAAIEAKFWANLCRTLGLDELIDAQYDDGTQDDARNALSQAFLARSRDDWVVLLADADTCVSPVLTATEAAADPGFVSRGCVASARPTTGDEWPQLAPLFAGARRETRYDLPDTSSTDTDGVLAGCGFTAEEISGLRDRGVVS
ncbi:MAG TPA: CaiB/BaiF CoA-transferase family protein [Mycobacteriales bacterium]|jgi:alpha-methylacyl-CoA racemase|nr:CaiB/BaiF CoA-transferase family protein [Mycobacteriales bacterium]